MKSEQMIDGWALYRYFGVQRTVVDCFCPVPSACLNPHTLPRIYPPPPPNNRSLPSSLAHNYTVSFLSRLTACSKAGSASARTVLRRCSHPNQSLFCSTYPSSLASPRSASASLSGSKLVGTRHICECDSWGRCRCWEWPSRGYSSARRRRCSVQCSTELGASDGGRLTPILRLLALPKSNILILCFYFLLAESRFLPLSSL